ncbi:hypothetical protein SLE2022_357620 [Rubroshorea leprosula]
MALSSKSVDLRTDLAVSYCFEASIVDRRFQRGKWSLRHVLDGNCLALTMSTTTFRQMKGRDHCLGTSTSMFMI